MTHCQLPKGLVATINIILFGAPGSGKGTQAELVTAKLGLPAISTGNILREAVQQGTEVGLLAKSFIDNGALVPDEVMQRIVAERIAQPDCQKGFILDGFPRTIPQAEALDAMGVRIDVVLSLEVPDEDIKARMSGRRVCRGCGSAYHLIHHRPKTDSVCDLCGGELYQRTDDAPETVGKRLEVFHETTEPLKGYYENQGKLRCVAAGDDIEKVTARCLTALEIV